MWINSTKKSFIFLDNVSNFVLYNLMLCLNFKTQILNIYIKEFKVQLITLISDNLKILFFIL